MIKIYNTTDNLYLSDDVKNAFIHAYNLGKSDWSGNVNQAYSEWETEYENNSLQEVTKEEVIKAVATVMGTSTMAICDPEFGRGEKNSASRMYAAWFLYTYIDEPLMELAAFMKYKHHSSIIYSAHKLSDLMEVSKKGSRSEIKTTIGLIKARLVHRGYKLKCVMRSREAVDQIIELI